MTENTTTDPQDEVFDVVNEKDEVVGEATRSEVHQDPKLIHRAVHIWVLNDKREILLQQRGLNKDVTPGQWGASCAGHVKKGFSTKDTVKREFLEELGIRTDHKFISKLIRNSPGQTEMIYLYYAIHNGPFIFNKNEIQQVQFFSKDEVFKLIKCDTKVSNLVKEEIPIVFAFLER